MLRNNSLIGLFMALFKTQSSTENKSELNRQGANHMKLSPKLIIAALFATFISFSSLANDEQKLSINLMEYMNSSLEKTLPAYYMWDEQQVPSFKLQDANLDLLSSAAQVNGEDLKAFEFLTEKLRQGQLFVDDKKTLVLVKFSSTLGECKACNIAYDNLQTSKDSDLKDTNIIIVEIVN